MPLVAVKVDRKQGFVAADSHSAERVLVGHGRTEDFAIVAEADEAPVEKVIQTRVRGGCR